MSSSRTPLTSQASLRETSSWKCSQQHAQDHHGHRRVQAATELTALVKITGRAMGKKYKQQPHRESDHRDFSKRPTAWRPEHPLKWPGRVHWRMFSSATNPAM